MEFKKLTSCLLSLILMVSLTAPINAATTKNETLYDFLKNNENIKASYKYPSMKLTSRTEGKTKLSANTPVILKNRYTVSTKTLVSGNSILFTVLDDVKDETGTIIENLMFQD